MTRITYEQREEAWRMYERGENISHIARSVRVSYSFAWILTEGRKQGFKNYSKYQESLAVKKGFKNRSEYQESLAVKKGFKNYSKYQESLAQQRSQRQANRELSDLIKSRLKDLGKNKNWLAGQIKETNQTISRYVHGKNLPKVEILEKLLVILEVKEKPKSLDELIER
jgi:ribosome-binding protein aMBF1 (putative translation factor)